MFKINKMKRKNKKLQKYKRKSKRIKRNKYNWIN